MTNSCLGHPPPSIISTKSFQGTNTMSGTKYNIQIIGVPEEDKTEGHEKIFEEIIVENFPKMGKEISTQIQETQRVPNRINPR